MVGLQVMEIRFQSLECPDFWGLKKRSCCYRVGKAFIFYVHLVKFYTGSVEQKASSISDFVCIYFS